MDLINEVPEVIKPEDVVELESKYLKEPIVPIDSFNDPLLPQFVKTTAQYNGFIKPTPIQRYSIPIATKGYDLISVAKTGSGKTFAFMIPLMIKLNAIKNNTAGGQLNPAQMMMMNSNSPLAVVLAPTRELAI